MKKVRTSVLNKTVARHCLGFDAEHKGKLYGVELELEGRGVRLDGAPTKGWNRHDDGSLRGESIEYTLAVPSDLEATKKAVDVLYEKMNDGKVQFNNSFRTSTHIHLNFSDQPIKKALNFFFVFTMLEELLENYSGEDRGGNLFCMSSRRADRIVDVINQAIKDNNFRMFAGDRFKYAACNLSTLYKFGTVEVRTLRGADEPEMVKNWLDILDQIYQYSDRLASPTDLCASVSLLGGDGMLRAIFTGETFDKLMAAQPPGFDPYASCIAGIRCFQHVAYEHDEDFRKEIEEPQKREGGLKRRDVNHNAPVIYNPIRGRRWICTGLWRDEDPEYFIDGEPLGDDDNIWWSEAEDSFMCEDENGALIRCEFNFRPE